MGRGILKILNEAKKANIPIPIFKYDDSGFYVIFNFEKENIEDGILRLLNLDPGITRLEISELLKVSDSSVKRALKNMAANNVIERVGSTRKGTWRIL